MKFFSETKVLQIKQTYGLKGKKGKQIFNITY